MATDTYKTLASYVATTSAAAAYTVPASTSAIIKNITITNINAPAGASTTIQLWQNGTTDAFMILNTTTILAAYTLNGDGTITLATGGIIYAKAGALTTITVTINGVEIT